VSASPCHHRQAHGDGASDIGRINLQPARVTYSDRATPPSARHRRNTSSTRLPGAILSAICRSGRSLVVVWPNAVRAEPVGPVLNSVSFDESGQRTRHGHFPSPAFREPVDNPVHLRIFLRQKFVMTERARHSSMKLTSAPPFEHVDDRARFLWSGRPVAVEADQANGFSDPLNALATRRHGLRDRNSPSR
jgi:hypothetical protein